jgi:hypothetical protein
VVKNADRHISKIKMFQKVRENLDENLGRLYSIKENFEGHEFLSENRELQKLFDDASEMLDGLSGESVHRPYKRFLDQFNKIESMLNEVKSRCLFGR